MGTRGLVVLFGRTQDTFRLPSAGTGVVLGDGFASGGCRGWLRFGTRRRWPRTGATRGRLCLLGGDPGLLAGGWMGMGTVFPVAAQGGRGQLAVPCRAVLCRAVPCGAAVGWGLGQVLQGLRRSPTRPRFLRPLRLGRAGLPWGDERRLRKLAAPPPVRGLRGLPEQGSLRAARSPPQPGSSSRPCSPRPRVPSSLATCSPASLQPWPLDVRVYPLPPWPDPPSRTRPWWRGGHLSRGVLSGAPGGSLAAGSPLQSSRGEAAKGQTGEAGASFGVSTGLGRWGSRTPTWHLPNHRGQTQGSRVLPEKQPQELKRRWILKINARLAWFRVLPPPSSAPAKPCGLHHGSI